MYDAFSDSDAPALAAAPTVEWMRDDDARRFMNHKRVGWIGLGVAVGGVVGIGVFGIGTGACLQTGNLCAVPLLGLTVVSGVAVIGGDVAFHYGGIAAAYDGRRLGLKVSPVTGWVGVGLVGASLALGAAVDPESPQAALVSNLSTGVALGALGCGIGQLVIDGHAGRAGGIAIAPRPGGLLIAGRF